MKIEVVYDTKFYDQFTKLLAEENISREVRDVKTAYFDLESRSVVIPKWHENLSDNVRKFLHCHEVSHAKYTPKANWHEFIKKYNNVSASYLNVCEDARVDSLMTHKFKGLRLVYNEAYMELYESGFFSKTWDEMDNDKLFVNRFNMMTKMGTYCKIYPKNSIEQTFLDRSNNMRSFKEVSKLAYDILKYDEMLSQNSNNIDKNVIKYIENGDTNFENKYEAIIISEDELEAIVEKFMEDTIDSPIKDGDIEEINDEKDISDILNSTTKKSIKESSINLTMFGKPTKSPTPLKDVHKRIYDATEFIKNSNNSKRYRDFIDRYNKIYKPEG